MRRLAVLVIDIALLLLGKGAYIVFYLLGWRFIYKIGRLTGDVNYLLNARKRRIIQNEIAMLFGSRFDREKVKDIAKRSFENYYKRQIETIFFGCLDKQTVEKMIHSEGLENIELALSKEKGVIILLSHFGSFLLPLPFLGYRGYKVNQITGKQIHTSLISERIWKWRRREANKLPIKFLQANTFFRPAYKALNNNEIVVVAFDGRDSSRWVTTDFFQRKARFSPGPFELARRTGAVILPTFTIREKNGFHKLVLKPSFSLAYWPDQEQAIAADIRNFSELFTRYIEKYPCHFAMVLYKLISMNEEGIGNSFFVDEYNEHHPNHSNSS